MYIKKFKQYINEQEENEQEEMYGYYIEYLDGGSEQVGNPITNINQLNVGQEYLLADLASLYWGSGFRYDGDIEGMHRFTDIQYQFASEDENILNYSTEELDELISNNAIAIDLNANNSDIEKPIQSNTQAHVEKGPFDKDSLQQILDNNSKYQYLHIKSGDDTYDFNNNTLEIQDKHLVLYDLKIPIADIEYLEFS
jgi:hypothetical protein